MSTIDTKDRVKCALTADITASQTLLPVGPGGQDFQAASGHATMAVIRDAERAEVVKVTGVSFGALTVERGQDGSTPRAFKLGALVSMRPVESTLAQYQQKGVMRQVAYNPNGVLMPAYFGEKVAEIGVEGCTHRVWQNVVPDEMSWRIVYGYMCKDLTYWRDWDYYKFVIDWEWPDLDFPAVCSLDEGVESIIFDSSNMLTLYLRGCDFKDVDVGTTVAVWPDVSGRENSLFEDRRETPGDTGCLYKSFSDSVISYPIADIEGSLQSADYINNYGDGVEKTVFIIYKIYDLGRFYGELNLGAVSFSFGTSEYSGEITGRSFTPFVWFGPDEYASTHNSPFEPISIDGYLGTHCISLRVVKSGGLEVRLDGSTVYSTSAIPAGEESEFANLILADKRGLIRCALFSSSEKSFGFSDILCFDKALSDEDRAAIEAGIMAQHGYVI